MKPRIFVSSTYYDLKYIRENISRFIRSFGFEPVLFESGSVHFEHGKALDLSCYKEVQHSHMMILIIGGRYGSSSSEEDQTEFIKKYESNYISITRNEFRNAQKDNIPIFVFIEKNTYAEYYTYSKNRQFFITEKNLSNNFEFAHVDSTNVFDFIDEVKQYAIKTFEKFEEIEDYLSNQWSSMFYDYLIDLKKKKNNDKVFNSVSELQSITEKMNEMIDVIGKNILSESGEYETTLIKQNEKQILFYTESIVNKLIHNNMGIRPSTYDIPKDKIFQLSEILIDEFFKYDSIWNEDGKLNEMEFILGGADDKLSDIVQPLLSNIHKNLRFENPNFIDIFKIYEAKIKPLLDLPIYLSSFKEALQNELELHLEIPF